jgi:GNAT superfamily N-acetyltransferase
MSFIKDIWGGHDYIPHVWDEWLKDEHGKMFVVEVEGKPVGMNRVRFLEDGSAWFEGARVHPDFRGKGLASMLGESSMKFAKEKGVGIFRLTSGSHNRVARRQIERIRFSEVSKFSVYEPKNGRRPMAAQDVQRVTIGEASEFSRLAKNSREYTLGTGVFWHDFAAAALTPDVTRGLAEEGALWRLGNAVAVTREGGEGSEIWEEVCFLGGPVLEANRLVRSLIGRNRKASKRWVFLPQGSPLIRALRKGGFERNFSMILFERRATND